MKTKRFRRKSQMELFGLAIVVVVIILATIFMVGYLAGKKPSEVRKSFVESQLASSMINTLTKTSVQEAGISTVCNRISLSELVRLCGKKVDCGGKEACQVAEDIIGGIIGRTIGIWSPERYHFIWKSEDEPPSVDIEFGSACRGDKKFKQYVIPGSPRTLVNLEICS